MKLTKTALLYASLLLVFASTVLSQTNQVPPTPLTFWGDLTSWLTSHNTNNTTLLDNHGLIWTGAVYQDQLNVANSLGLEYNAYRPTKTTAVRLESIMQNAGIAGTVVSHQAGVGFDFILYDTKVGASAGGGYSFYKDRGFGYVSLEAVKMVAAHSCVGTRMDIEFQKDPNPTVTAFFGASF